MSATAKNGGHRPVIHSVSPPAAIAGGDLELRGSGLAPSGERQSEVYFGEARGRLVIGGSARVVVRVPPEAQIDGLVLLADGESSEPQTVSIGIPVAENLHPVANPAVDAEGNIFTTRSGTRGEKVPVSIFKIDTSLEIQPVISDVVNPTGLAVNRDGSLLVSSRHDGTIYSIAESGQVEVYAEGMGVATGIALDPDGNLYVGDRTGTIFKIAPDRQIFVFATLEPSVAAYHLVFGPEGDLFVTGPTTSSFDAVMRIDRGGEVHEYVRGFGRPQGMAFDRAGKLFVAASYHGAKGIFRIDAEGDIRQMVSGPGVVGLAFLPDHAMVVATSSTIYRVSTQGWIEG
jgi:sugar lactone lactonase YvrE